MEGGLDAPWMSIFTSAEEDQQGKAWTIANLQIDAVRSLVARAPEKFALLLSPKDVEKPTSARCMLPMGMENGAPIGDDLGKVQFFFDRGIRYITLCHGDDNRIADSSYVETHKWGGLSPFGEKVVAEMNRLGIIVDVSHVSDDAVRDVLRITDVPGDREPLGPAPLHADLESQPARRPRGRDREGRRRDPAVLRHGVPVRQAVAGMGGQARADGGDEEGRQVVGGDRSRSTSSSTKAHPAPVLHVDAVLDQIDYGVKLVGVDHIGIGSDFDGVSASCRST